MRFLPRRLRARMSFSATIPGKQNFPGARGTREIHIRLTSLPGGGVSDRDILRHALAQMHREGVPDPEVRKVMRMIRELLRSRVPREWRHEPWKGDEECTRAPR